MDTIINLILFAGMAFCWWRIVSMPLGNEHYGIEKDMHGNGAHGPHRKGARHWWTR